MVTEEELGVVSLQTAMCIGISIDTVADMVFRPCHEALPSCGVGEFSFQSQL